MRKIGEWYWVRRTLKEKPVWIPEQDIKQYIKDIESSWFPAMYDPESCNGWTNGDTWEDFYSEVIEWKKIPYPKPKNNKIIKNMRTTIKLHKPKKRKRSKKP